VEGAEDDANGEEEEKAKEEAEEEAKKEAEALTRMLHAMSPALRRYTVSMCQYPGALALETWGSDVDGRELGDALLACGGTCASQSHCMGDVAHEALVALVQVYSSLCRSYVLRLSSLLFSARCCA